MAMFSRVHRVTDSTRAPRRAVTASDSQTAENPVESGVFVYMTQNNHFTYLLFTDMTEAQDCSWHRTEQTCYSMVDPGAGLSCELSKGDCQTPT